MRAKSNKTGASVKIQNKARNKLLRKKYRQHNPKPATQHPKHEKVKSATSKKDKMEILKQKDKKIEISTFRQVFDQMDQVIDNLENQPRKFNLVEKTQEQQIYPNVYDKNQKYRLPVKNEDGEIVHRVLVENKEKNIHDMEQDHEQQESKEIGEHSVKEIVRSLEEIRIEIVKICHAVTAEPHEYITSLGRLMDYYNHTNMVVRRIALASATEVFLDLIPGYRVRTITENEKTIKGSRVSKETRKIWNYEACLLSRYRKHVGALYKIVGGLHRHQKSGRNTKPSALSLLALKCLCTLLVNCFHFNCAKELVDAIVPLLNHKNPIINEECYNCIIEIFELDKTGSAILEIIRWIRKIVQANPMTCNPLLVKVMINLKLHSRISEADTLRQIRLEEDAEKKRHKKKKKTQLEADLEKDLQYAEAEICPEKKVRIQSTILENVVWLYFRILKDGMRNSEAVLGFVLEGLGKYCELVNVELLLDSVEHLKNILIQGKDKLTVKTQVYCLLCTMNLMSGNADCLLLDMREIHMNAYRLLGMIRDRLNTSCQSVRESVPLILRAIEALFISGKRSEKHALDRIVAIVKRLFEVSLQLQPDLAIGVLHVAFRLVNKYPLGENLLNEPLQRGIYRWSHHDPDQANATSTSAWEFGLLSLHYHPAVRTFIDMWRKNNPSPSLLATNAEKVIESYNLAQVTFRPPVILPGVSKSSEKKQGARFKRLRSTVGEMTGDLGQFRDQIAESLQVPSEIPILWQTLFSKRQ